MFYKPSVKLQLDTIDWNQTSRIVWEPRVIRAKWTKNHHLAADELDVTLGWGDAGADPRMLKHARCMFWMWDDYNVVEDDTLSLRFTGICKKASRRLTSAGWVVDMLFQDYTTLFLAMKPFPSEGMPEWSDNLTAIWQKIRDNTGYRDRTQGKIISNVAQLTTMVFDPPEINSRTLGESVSERFHAISKPTPPSRCDAWKVWQWCVASLGLVSYIDKDAVVISTTNELYEEGKAAQLIYGQNISEFDESADTHISGKGILGKAFDPLKGVLLESAWPPPEDPAIKKSRAVAKRAAKAGRDVSLNETSAEYEEFSFPGITDQKTLDDVVKSGYEEFARQEVKGKIKTSEMFLTGLNGETIDILGLRAGDCVQVGIDKTAYDIARGEGPLAQKVQALMAACGYQQAVAELVITTITEKAFDNLIFHVETLEVEFEEGSFSIDISYHNKVYV